MKLSNPLLLNNHILTQQISPKKSYSLFATGSSFFQSGNTPSPFSLTSPPPPLSSPFSPMLLSPSPSPLPTPPPSPPPLSLLRSSVNTLTSLALSSGLLSSSSLFVYGRCPPICWYIRGTLINAHCSIPLASPCSELMKPYLEWCTAPIGFHKSTSCCPVFCIP